MKNKQFPAHINKDGDIQSVADHCINTAEIARERFNCIGFGNIAYLAGILHDCGKCHTLFADYIYAAAKGEKTQRGSVIHSFAGCADMLKKYHQNCKDVDADNYIKKITVEIIACSVASHHGLFDIFDENNQNGFEHRLEKQPDFDNKAIENFYTDVIDEAESARLFDLACEETEKFLLRLNELDYKNDEMYFYIGLLCRSITSAVIDGDRTDTSVFMENDHPEGITTDSLYWQKCRNCLENRISSLPCVNNISTARRELSELCVNFASEAPGIYRLNIPTGGGKTLSSLRYAVAHAALYGKKRIIYTAPLISILEQNAEEIRKALPENAVLEHHTDVLIEDEKENADRHYFEENWNSPVIVTTLVQLLNTLFSDKTTCVRRLCSLCDSVIIIDEVQSVPSKMLTLFDLAMNFLAEFCGATVILCSATQPCFENLPHDIHFKEKEIISPETYRFYYDIFKRNKIINAGNYSLVDIPGFAEEIIPMHNSLLVVCNKKDQAEYVFGVLSGKFDNCFHLSAGMCSAHRKDVLNSVFAALAEKKRVICVSTQVIEAGVDISFSAVIRLTAGMDSIVQSAGRCNRHGESVCEAPVYIVNCVDENLKRLPDIALSKDASLELIASFEKNACPFDDDLSSLKSVDYFYKRLYAKYPKNHFDYILKDAPSLYSLLSENDEYADEKTCMRYFLRQAFKKAGENFEVFDSSTYSVVVPYSDGENCIAGLVNSYASKDYVTFNKQLRLAKQYSVTVYDYQMKLLKEKSAVTMICGGLVYILDPRYYGSTGIIKEPKEGKECILIL